MQSLGASRQTERVDSRSHTSPKLKPGRMQSLARQSRRPALLHPEGVSAPHAIALVAAAAALGGLGTAAVADATHKGTHDLWYHGLGDCCGGDGTLHPFMSEVTRTSRNSYVAIGQCCGHPAGYDHGPEQFDDDWHNHIHVSTVGSWERYHFASVRSPVTGLAHQHHVCGDGDCVGAQAADYKE